MKLLILVDNHTIIDQYYLGEPGVSFYLEVDGLRVLFDTGYSDILLSNAKAMGIDLGNLTHIILSHGHNDHTRGLSALARNFDLSQVKIIAHPGCFFPKSCDGLDIGAPFTAAQIAKLGNYVPAEAPLSLSEHCVFLGQIPASNDFETRLPFGRFCDDGRWQTDFVMDDSAIVCKTASGLFIVTGCSHSGICNIARCAMEVCGDHRIAGILGGFHLMRDDARLDRTIDVLAKLDISALYPCHCVCLPAKAKMLARLPNVQEVGVGTRIEIS